MSSLDEFRHFILRFDRQANWIIIEPDVADWNSQGHTENPEEATQFQSVADAQKQLRGIHGALIYGVHGDGMVELLESRYQINPA